LIRFRVAPSSVVWFVLLTLSRTSFADPPASDDGGASVEVRAARPVSRGIDDVRLTRDVLGDSPRSKSSELLSAAPGFFVDHEEGEGVGNDVYLRGFDLEHGAGIEMKVGGVPINAPTHVLGQGYADIDFVIPEVVRSVRVLEGPYDPRQGDAAIVGSADFDLGVAERGYQVGASYGSFGETRLLGVAAPRGADSQTFAAFALRKTDGFGPNRAARSASVNAQYAVDLGASDHLRLLATGYGTRSELAGYVRQDDVDAGAIGYYDSYPSFAEHQSAVSSRFIVSADFEHIGDSGFVFEARPWVALTDLRLRQNFTGALESSQIDPNQVGRGDLFESTNAETAAGIEAHIKSAAIQLGDVARVVLDPGVVARVGHSNQGRNLLDPENLAVWDRRIDAALQTIDVGACADVDLELGKRLRVSGGPRVDLLSEHVDDRLANVLPGREPERTATGVAVGPRVTARYELTPVLSTQVAYGEGFRSLDAQHLKEGAAPFSRVRSFEGGLHAEDERHRYTTNLAIFETQVGNELVFVADAGGYETEGPSTRRGVVSSFLARPFEWLLASTALTVTDAVFDTRVPGISHHVPSVPPILFRADVSVHRDLARVGARPLTGRVRVGYTFLSGRHLTDAIVGPASNVLNAGLGFRYSAFELELEAYNLLGLRYADDAEAYASNWSPSGAPRPPSVATHVSAAPPRTVVGTLLVHF
jgi:hypothetical protein